MINRTALVLTLFLGACADQAAVAPPAPAPEAAVNLTGALFPSAWSAKDIAGAPVIAGSQVTLAFDANGRVSGRGGCNNFAGSAALDADRIIFTPLAATQMACVDSAVSMQEGAYFEALGEVERAAVAADGQLRLYGADNVTLLVFGPAAAQ